MIDWIIRFSIRRRGLVILAGLALAVWGALAVRDTPVDAVPDLSENQVIVFTDWPGHSPREIEDQVTALLTMNLQGLAGVRVVRGSSEFGFSLIHLIFEDSAGFTESRDRVRERLFELTARLPAGAVARLAPDGIATGQIFWYTLDGRGYDLGRLRALQDWYVGPQLAATPGVAEVAGVGGQAVEYHVNIDPDRLRVLQVELAEVAAAIAQASRASGAGVVQQGTAEFLVHSHPALGTDDAAEPGAAAVSIVHELQEVPVLTRGGRRVRLGDLAAVTLGGRARRGVLEKDGNEAVGGVVLMRYGENPLEVTRRIRRAIGQLQAGLPAGVHIVPCYDRTPLIEGAIGTVTSTVLEAMLGATFCVVLMLRHWRSSFVIVATLPLAALGAFVILSVLRRLGLAGVETNIMSLAGIAISIGVLVDSSIVMTENVMHHLQLKFGEEPVRGDVRGVVATACLTVGRPIVFSILIMLISFLPVFTLEGIDGRMFRPLAFTKSFALITAAVLSITIVPALCTVFIRGKLRPEADSWFVRSVMDVYRPVLDYLLDRPAPLVWLLAATFVCAVVPLGSLRLFSLVLFAALAATGCSLPGVAWRAAGMAAVVVVALIAERSMRPLGIELRLPLDEGMVMDMPITIPRASITRNVDDLKARDMLLCRFPEVAMVVGKGGRADSAFDPAPLDMIETMLEFQPRDLWPRRAVSAGDAARQVRALWAVLEAARLIAPAADAQQAANWREEVAREALVRYDAVMREAAYQARQEYAPTLEIELVKYVIARTAASLTRQGALAGPIGPGELALIARAVPPDLPPRLALAMLPEDVAWLAGETVSRLQALGLAPTDRDVYADPPPLWLRPYVVARELWGAPPETFNSRLLVDVQSERSRLWKLQVRQMNRDLARRAAAIFPRLVCEEIFNRAAIIDPALAERQRQVAAARRPVPAAATVSEGTEHHHGLPTRPPLPIIEPHAVFDRLLSDAAERFSQQVALQPRSRDDLCGPGGELDQALQMPGWTNVWTMPIQNRVDMLATGVNTEVGVRVLGPDLGRVVRASEEIAAVLRELPGAANVIADPVRGKGYLEIRPDPARAADCGVRPGDLEDVLEAALGGKPAAEVRQGRERRVVRVRYAPDNCNSLEAVRALPIPARPPGETRGSGARTVALAEVAAVDLAEGPATIKSENGLLRNYVRLNVVGRSPLTFVEEARRVVAERVPLADGVFVEWTGQFEHAQHTTRRLLWMTPVVLGLILVLLYFTYHDLADACLMLLAVVGAMAGGVLFQWLFGYRFSVPVGVGYIACFGMASSTGIIMLVYIREAVERAGGLACLSPARLREAVLAGAAQRLRPKLLTEGTTILGLAPLLWAEGPGADLIRPMAAPVLGGLLIADEVIDLLLPVLFYRVRLWRLNRLSAAASGSPADGQRCDSPADFMLVSPTAK